MSTGIEKVSSDFQKNVQNKSAANLLGASMQSASPVDLPDGVSIEEFQRLGDGYYDNSVNLDAIFNKNQSATEMWAKGIAKFPTKIPGSLMVMLGNLGDAGDILSDDPVNELGNWLVDAGTKLNEGVDDAIGNIYEAEKGKFNPGDAAWWASGVGELGTTAALMALGMATGGASLALGAGELFGAVTAALISRASESLMDASELKKSTFDALMQRGAEKEEALNSASSAAANHFITTMPLVLIDFWQFGRAFSTAGKTAAKGAGKLAGDAAGEIAESEVKRGFMKTVFNAGKSMMASTPGGYIKNFGAEATEEGFQEYSRIIQEDTALRDFDGLEIRSAFDRHADYLTSDAVLTAAVHGGFGGIMFEGASPLMKKISNAYHANRLGMTQDEVKQMKENIKAFNAFKSSLSDDVSRNTAASAAENEEVKNTIKQASLIQNMLASYERDGNFDKFNELLKGFQQLSEDSEEGAKARENYAKLFKNFDAEGFKAQAKSIAEFSALANDIQTKINEAKDEASKPGNEHLNSERLHALVAEEAIRENLLNKIKTKKIEVEGNLNRRVGEEVGSMKLTPEQGNAVKLMLSPNSDEKLLNDIFNGFDEATRNTVTKAAEDVNKKLKEDFDNYNQYSLSEITHERRLNTIRSQKSSIKTMSGAIEDLEKAFNRVMGELDNDGNASYDIDEFNKIGERIDLLSNIRDKTNTSHAKKLKKLSDRYNKSAKIINEANRKKLDKLALKIKEKKAEVLLDLEKDELRAQKALDSKKHDIEALIADGFEEDSAEMREAKMKLDLAEQSLAYIRVLKDNIIKNVDERTGESLLDHYVSDLARVKLDIKNRFKKITHVFKKVYKRNNFFSNVDNSFIEAFLDSPVESNRFNILANEDLLDLIFSKIKNIDLSTSKDASISLPIKIGIDESGLHVIIDGNYYDIDLKDISSEYQYVFERLIPKESIKLEASFEKNSSALYSKAKDFVEDNGAEGWKVKMNSDGDLKIYKVVNGTEVYVSGIQDNSKIKSYKTGDTISKEDFFNALADVADNNGLPLVVSNKIDNGTIFSINGLSLFVDDSASNEKKANEQQQQAQDSEVSSAMPGESNKEQTTDQAKKNNELERLNLKRSKDQTGFDKYVYLIDLIIKHEHENIRIFEEEIEALEKKLSSSDNPLSIESNIEYLRKKLDLLYEERDYIEKINESLFGIDNQKIDANNESYTIVVPSLKIFHLLSRLQMGDIVTILDAETKVGRPNVFQTVDSKYAKTIVEVGGVQQEVFFKQTDPNYKGDFTGARIVVDKNPTSFVDNKLNKTVYLFTVKVKDGDKVIGEVALTDNSIKNISDMFERFDNEVYMPIPENNSLEGLELLNQALSSFDAQVNTQPTNVPNENLENKDNGIKLNSEEIQHAKEVMELTDEDIDNATEEDIVDIKKAYEDSKCKNV